MICNTIGQTADSYQSIYVTGGAEVAAIYGGLNYSDLIFLKSQTMTGDAPLMYDSYPGRLTDYTILGNSYQDGVPDPDHPVEVVSVGDRTENLFFPIVYDKYIDPGDGVLKAGNGYKTSDYISIVSDRYYCSAVLKSTAYFQCGYALYDSNRNYLRGATAFRFYGQPGALEKAAIDATGAAFIRISYNEALKNEMLNVGSEYISYEPYGYKLPITCGGVTQNIYLDEPLRKIGNYADEVDFKAGTVTRRIRAVALTGNEAWNVQLERYYLSLSGYTSLSSYGLCTHFKSGSGTAYSNSFILGTNAVFGVKNWFPTLQDFVQFLKAQYTAGTPITVYYPTTSTTEPITLPQILTLNGTNTLSIDTALPPSQISITGHVKPSSSYGNLTDKNGTYIKDKAGVQIKVTG